jgi:ER membrane protein complex subunit 4
MMFMLYMMGNGLQIFSIIMTLSGLMGPVTAIWSSGNVFPKDPDGKIMAWPPRLLYCSVHSVQLAFVVAKLQAMGLLPTEPSDWLSWAPAPLPAHVAGGMVA